MAGATDQELREPVSLGCAAGDCAAVAAAAKEVAMGEQGEQGNMHTVLCALAGGWAAAMGVAQRAQGVGASDKKRCDAHTVAIYRFA